MRGTTTRGAGTEAHFAHTPRAMKAVLIRVAALLLANGVASFHITPVVRPTRLHPKAVTMNEDEPQEAPAAAAPWSTGNAQLDVVVRRIEQEVADAIIRETEAKAASSGGDSAGYCTLHNCPTHI